MRIVIDLQGAQTESRQRGIGRYSLSLLEAMLRQQRGHDYWIVSNGHLEAAALDSLAQWLPPERVLNFHCPQPVEWRNPANAWRRQAAERAREAFLLALRPDIVHVSSLVEGAQEDAVTSIGKRTNSPPTAATLYDLIPLHNPDYLGADYLKSWYQDKIASFRRADLLLAISDYVARDVGEMLSIPTDRVVNIASAVSDLFRPVLIDEQVRRSFRENFSIQGDYLLCSGGMEPRKNLERLLAAYARLPGVLRGRYQLVVIGRLADLERDRLALVMARLKIDSDRVLAVGHVSDQALVELYCGAELFIFPSLQEGFGLPVLEAMACGTAVIGSSATSVPEVLGRSDALFDPTSVSAMSALIQRVLELPDYAQTLRAHGLRQAKLFSWESSAARALEAFEAVHERGHKAFSWKHGIGQIEADRGGLIQEIANTCAVNEVASSEDLLATAAAIAANEELAREVLRREIPLSATPSWRLEGPFDSSYSLALVNRELARALDGLGLQVALHATDGAGDLVPDPAFLAGEPAIAAMYRKSTTLMPEDVDVSSRLLYPPRVADMSSRFNLLHAYAWEESEIPRAWVDDFNEFLQGISALSTHVEKVLIDSGVGLPLAVCGAGVDHWERIPDGGEFCLDAHSFRFLHVSSCMPRKGVDVLLKAYGDAFTAADDVSLVIKTFSNPQNDVRRWLREAKQERADFPHVVIIERDISSIELKQLYAQCQAMVAPSRAEGFGLPLAEAMISGLAVITTGWGGQCDFCKPDTAWLIDYDFGPASALFGLPNAVWAEPSRAHLSLLMREVFDLPEKVRGERSERGGALLRRDFRWAQVARRLVDFARVLASHPRAAAPPVLAWIGSLHKDLGESDAAATLIQSIGGITVLADTENERQLSVDFRQCWRPLQSTLAADIGLVLENIGATVVVVHYQKGLMASSQLEALLRQQKALGRSLIFLVRAPVEETWSEGLIEALRACDRVLTHDLLGLNALKRTGIVENATILPVEDGAEGDSGAAAGAGFRLRNMMRAISWQQASMKLARPAKC